MRSPSSSLVASHIIIELHMLLRSVSHELELEFKDDPLIQELENRLQQQQNQITELQSKLSQGESSTQEPGSTLEERTAAMAAALAESQSLRQENEIQRNTSKRGA